MNADRLATFGRWAFFAGGTWALVWATLWRHFDWPAWFGALTAFAGSWAAFRLIDWLAGRSVIATVLDAGRCGEPCPVILTHSPRQVCALLAGHTGWHHADGGCEWGLINDTKEQ